MYMIHRWIESMDYWQCKDSVTISSQYRLYETSLFALVEERQDKRNDIGDIFYTGRRREM